MIGAVKAGVLGMIRGVGYSVRKEPEGYRLVKQRIWGQDYIDDLREISKIGGFSMETIVVAGAFEGAGTFSLAGAFPQADVFAFEPILKTFRVLTERASRHHNVICQRIALGDANAEHLMHVNVSPDTSSLMVAESGTDYEHLLREEGLEKVRAITLDHFAETENIQTIDYLHSDVQGYELNLLKGAAGLLKRGAIRCLLLEICFDALYVGQPSFAAILQEMDRYGYRLVCLQGLYFDRKPYPRSGNAIFFHP